MSSVKLSSLTGQARKPALRGPTCSCGSKRCLERGRACPPSAPTAEPHGASVACAGTLGFWGTEPAGAPRPWVGHGPCRRKRLLHLPLPRARGQACPLGPPRVPRLLPQETIIAELAPFRVRPRTAHGRTKADKGGHAHVYPARQGRPSVGRRRSGRKDRPSSNDQQLSRDRTRRGEP